MREDIFVPDEGQTDDDDDDAVDQPFSVNQT